MIGTPPYPKILVFRRFFVACRGFRSPKPFQTARTCFFYPGKARQCRFSWIQVRFRPISGFWDFRFLCPGILVLGFLSFRGPGSGFKSNYEQNQPSGGSFFSKKTPPWILRPSRVWIFQFSFQKSPKSSSLILKSETPAPFRMSFGSSFPLDLTLFDK